LTTLHRVLVVDDHAPARRIICSLLQQRTDVLIVGEAADGLDAIRQAEALRPEVVTLDIGLPILNGIEVATRIRSVVPDAKLIFVSIESSHEVAEQAFGAGGHGYVYKPRILRDLPPVFERIIRGARFVDGGLDRIAQGDSLAAHRHELVFCSNDAVLVGAFGRFIAGALAGGTAVIVAVTEAHERSLERSLLASHVDLALAIRQERYIPVNISQLLAKVMVHGRPNPSKFLNATEDVVAHARERAAGQHASVAACGECSSTVWIDGHLEAAVQLEHLWDEMSARHQMDILCAYPLTVRQNPAPAVRHLCAQHTAIEIS
jgi:DNA-binding NarL/FixJ family response regulator